ncbi:hypothetical protein NEIELOOT_02901 [Neisseria elongata subsp. glycolytica ATCC 29315]|uniref:Uncharacterized protein n=1 Tax=Neisseria elongata subsp. glycolytica ATCC 29315 TaxID=546263 RepID=D4DUY8_NEIEG|nr:hypothetical protein NEIELOOT_02901 [Neisseria elongata subsp. glycolytica ATCC 29315]
MLEKFSSDALPLSYPAIEVCWRQGGTRTRDLRTWNVIPPASVCRTGKGWAARLWQDSCFVLLVRRLFIQCNPAGIRP